MQLTALLGAFKIAVELSQKKAKYNMYPVVR
jgi:hypothetical protein